MLKNLLKSLKSTIIDDYYYIYQYDKETLNSLNEYFNLIKELIKKYNSDKNIQISEEKSNNINKIKIRDINYKTLILNYFANEFQRGILWVQDIYRDISEQVFPTENYLLLLFNIDEFELKIKPKCFDNQNKERLIPQSKYFTYEVIEDKNYDNLDIQNKLYKQNVYTYVKLIRMQVENPINPINFVLNKFKYYFTDIILQNKEELIDIKLHKSNELFKRKSEKICNDLFDQINKFILYLTKTLTTLYSKICSYNIFFEEIDEFISLLISILFEKKNQNDVLCEHNELYKVVIDLLRIKKFDEIQKLKNIIKNKKYTEPQDFGVQDKFCLNNKSINYYIKKYKKEFTGKLPETPFNDSIEMFKKITEYNSPIDKLILTKNLTKSIRKDIHNFWNQLPKEEYEVLEQSFEIEADDFINIFEYIIINSKISDLDVHIEFIETFINEKIRTDINEYNLNMIKVGLMQIIDVNSKGN